MASGPWGPARPFRPRSGLTALRAGLGAWYPLLPSVIEYIEAIRVTRRFGTTIALRGVSTRFEAGVISFIEGPNGAGKSTLLAVIGTGLRATSGAIRYGALGTDRVRARPYIGWVAHESRAYRELSGRQNVELTARLYGVDPAEAWERVAARVGAERFGDQAVGTLSRGQRQRIALARALVHEPAVLLLDEPVSGLDAASMERLEAILTEERDAGRVVIVVSHTAELMRRLGGPRLRLVRGRVAEGS